MWTTVFAVIAMAAAVMSLVFSRRAIRASDRAAEKAGRAVQKAELAYKALHLGSMRSSIKGVPSDVASSQITGYRVRH